MTGLPNFLALARRLEQALQGALQDTPDTTDPMTVVSTVGPAPADLLAWVRDNTAWIP